MIRFLKTSLLRKLAIYYSTVSFAIVILVAGTAYTLARSSLKQSMIDQLRLATFLKRNEVEQWFTLQRQDVLFLSQLPDIKEQTEGLLEVDGDRDLFYLTIKDILSDIAQVKSNIKIMSIVSNQGIVLVSTDTLLEKTYQPLGHLTTYITDLESPINPVFYNSVITNRKAITFVTPIYNSAQDKIAYISIELDLGEIDRSLQKPNQMQQTVQTYLIGRIGAKNEFINSSPLTNQSSDLDLDLHSFAIDSALQGGNGWGLYINHSQVPVLGLYRWVEDKNMALISEISQKEGFYLAEDLARKILIIGLFFIAIVLTLIYIVSRKIVKPVLEISEATLQISKGDFNCRVPVISQDEMGKLAIAFNIMVEKLNQSFHAIELANQELQAKIIESQKAQQTAEIANRVKSDFIAQMTHELRTPLNSILGFSQVLYDDPMIPQKQKSFLQAISKSGKRLLGLINDVIDLSKTGENRQLSRIMVASIADILQQITSDFKVSLREKNLPLICQVDENVPKVIQADTESLSRICIHLLDNAIKFTEKGEIYLKIHCLQNNLNYSQKNQPLASPNIDSENWLKLQIQDTGCGMKDEELSHVFEPFSRHIKPIGFQTGMGLGLPICQKLVHEMGGEITVESEVKIGTIVTVTVPFQRVEKISQLPSEYTEEGGGSLSDPSPSFVSLDELAEELSGLPQSWLNSLYSACCQADDEQVIQLLEELPEQDQRISITIAELAMNYRLDKILEILELLVISRDLEIESED